MNDEKFNKVYIGIGKINLCIILIFDLFYVLGQIEPTSILIPYLIYANAALCIYFIVYYIIDYKDKNE